MMLAKEFRKILDEYPIERAEDFKKSDFPQYLSKSLTNKFTIPDDFIARPSCGKSRWAENPWISITHKSFDSAQESLQIEYKFLCEKSEVQLSLIPRLEIYDEYTSLKAILMDILEGIDLNDFSINYNDDSYSILDKKYGYDELDDISLDEDLEFLMSIYRELQVHFNIFIESRKNPQEKCSFAFKMTDADLEFMEFDEKILYKAEKPRITIKDITASYPRQNKFSKSISTADELFTDDNIEKIIRCDIKMKDYQSILEDITQTSQLTLIGLIKANQLSLNDLDIKNKILLFAKSFTDVEYKSIGRLMGSYAFNNIRIDDRLSNPLIITSIIHELSHFLVEKILKEILMKILETNDTPLVSAFVKILLEDDLNYLLDEFAAHTVEGRFALYGFQDYSSFTYKLDEISHLYSQDDIDYALLAANTFAYDIKDILEEFIDENLRDEIKEEFLKLHDRPNYEPLDLEIDSRLEEDNWIEALALILTAGIPEALNNPEKLERYMARFE